MSILPSITVPTCELDSWMRGVEAVTEMDSVIWPTSRRMSTVAV